MLREWKYTRVDLSTNSTTVNSKPALLKGVFVNVTLSAHACPIKDDTAEVYTIPASDPAGNKYDFEGTRFLTSLVVDPDDSATGSITLMWRDLRA